MSTSQSVYPPHVADKCVALLCEQQGSAQPAAKHLMAARFLMLYGYVEKRADGATKSASFSVQSPDMPRFYYQVDLHSETCNCGYFMRKQRPCKHLYAVVLTLIAQYKLGIRPSALQPYRRSR